LALSGIPSLYAEDEASTSDRSWRVERVLEISKREFKQERMGDCMANEFLSKLETIIRLGAICVYACFHVFYPGGHQVPFHQE
jgi:hypothetical protein